MYISNTIFKYSLLMISLSYLKLLFGEKLQKISFLVSFQFYCSEPNHLEPMFICTIILQVRYSKTENYHKISKHKSVDFSNKCCRKCRDQCFSNFPKYPKPYH